MAAKPKLLQERIGRAKELLATVRHAALATVNPDDSPHNSPVFATFDDQLNFYWASGQDTQHSQNIARDGRVFIVVFDSFNSGGGLYMQATAQPLIGQELEAGLKIFNANCTRWELPPADPDFYQGTRPQRLYKAACHTAWVNITESAPNGEILREYRHQITAADLLH